MQYKLKDTLGEGASGVVKRAKCLSTGKTVAIKLVKGVFSDTYSARRIVREIEILKKLSKSN